MPPILYLIDGHALAYRTYFALTAGVQNDRLQTSKGEPTAGIYGFANVLMRLLEQEKPEYLAVAFDTGKTFRNDLSPEYKATRAKMPDDLRPQIERIRQMVDAFHLPRLEKEGVEADDVLGTIAQQAVEEGFGVKIITGDRDLLQLVNDRVVVSLAGTKLSEARSYTKKDVFDYLGVRPDQVVDYKALVGDSSDNYKGVPGIGEKTATGLLEKYQTYEEIYNHLDEIPPRFANKLKEGKESGDLSKKLAQIKTDVPIKLVLEDAKTDHINAAALESLFRELEFRTLIPRMHSIVAPLVKQAPAGQMNLFASDVKEISIPETYKLHTITVDTPEKLKELVGVISSSKLVSLDTETSSTDPMQARLVGISLAVKEGEGYYIPVGHIGLSNQLPVEDVIKALTPALTDSKIEKIGHNLKFDALMLLNNGLQVKPLTFDTMLAQWIIDPSSRVGLKEIAGVHLNATMTHIEDLIGTGKNQMSMEQVPVEAAAPYAAADAEVCLRLMPILKKKLEERASTSIFTDIEMPLIPILMEMEKNGIAVDAEFFKKFSAETGKRLNEIETQVYKAVGYSFQFKFHPTAF